MNFGSLLTLTKTEYPSDLLNKIISIRLQDSADNFIRTKFRYWGNGTNDHLPNWKANSNQNVTDAITGATLGTYATKLLTWDGTV